MYIFFFVEKEEFAMCLFCGEGRGVPDVRMMCASVGFVGQVETGFFS